MKKTTQTIKLYKINGERFTIDQLKEGYRVFRGMDSEADIIISDEEVSEFMKQALFEELIKLNNSKNLVVVERADETPSHDDLINVSYDPFAPRIFANIHDVENFGCRIDGEEQGGYRK